ncbi:PREDICTED: T-cell antigen CD7 [Chaetura pelagica]|uniref:T-cell antigen CD7 n=1 Tax=Chaetura pelagica TaxID=8897 RepID=UPI0005233EA8|nr:PREDICTED: T-cell antigen CD7 [Chaetura pelagica]
MPSGIPARGTPDSSSGRTDVTVYSCKSDLCNSSNYEGCDIIGETQNKAFSNERIELVIRKRDIIVCFRQNNVSLEGAYVIFWDKVDVGVGDSCGILNSGGNTSGAVEQSPLYVAAEPGQSVSITCALQSSQEDKGIYLLKTHTRHEQVLFVSGRNVSTVSPAFADRLEYSKGENKIVVTLHNLQKNDSDIYVCAGVPKGSLFLSANRSGTMMLVKEVEQTGCSSSSWGIYGLTIVVVILFSALMCSILSHVNLKQYFKTRKRNEVYEDMSYSSRRNTLVRANTYSG